MADPAEDPSPMTVPPAVDAEPPRPAAAQVVQVFRGADIHAVAGANLGDGLGAPQELCPGDVYVLDPAARALRLSLARPGGGPAGSRQIVAPGSCFGTPGDPVELAARLTFMTAEADRVEVLLLRHGADAAQTGGTILVLPLMPLSPRRDYTLIEVEHAPAVAELAQLLCLSFLRGTQIALATGVQIAVERLVPGDRVLTRDHGPQPVRWIGRATLRASGPLAPVVIGSGALGNAGDLLVGPHHRLFLYLRHRLPALATAEILVQAHNLVDGQKIFRREGGFADFFSLVFDRHEIIYAHGIPVESLMVNEATVPRLPAELSEALRSRMPGLRQSQHYGTEIGRAEIAALTEAGFLGAGPELPRRDRQPR
ncbi:MAG: Hint domain-containing protein [Gemmobacter sp.]